MKGNRKQINRQKIQNLLNPMGIGIVYAPTYALSHTNRLHRKKPTDSVLKKFGDWLMAKVFRFVTYTLLGSILISVAVIYGIIYISAAGGVLIGILLLILFMTFTMYIMKATKK
jgi:sulfite exporter TauE/SafE